VLVPAAIAEKEEEEEEGTRTKGCVRCPRCPWRGLRRLVWGILLGGGVALAWAGGTHCARRTLQTLPAPFFITWFASTWNLLFFPLYYLGHLLGADKRQWPVTRFRQCSELLGEGGVASGGWARWRGLLWRVALFSALWSIATFLYLLSLRRISPGDASTVLCCSPAFLFLLAQINDNIISPFLSSKIVAVILSITGIVMMAYADGFHSDSITGVALAVGSASTSAFYNVLVKLLVGCPGPGGVAVLQSCAGLCSAALQGWLCALLYLSGVEYWSPTLPLPWTQLCELACLLLSFNILVHFGDTFTHPAFISFGILLSVPTNTVMSMYLDPALQFSQVRLAATGIIASGFLLLLLPERWDESVLSWLGGLRVGRHREEHLEEAGEGAVTSRAKPKLSGLQ
ncbi:S35F4 protein, partial [Amia calva]|nr:S35F4 protein [Amia calva]